MLNVEYQVNLGALHSACSHPHNAIKVGVALSKFIRVFILRAVRTCSNIKMKMTQRTLIINALTVFTHTLSLMNMSLGNIRPTKF